MSTGTTPPEQHRDTNSGLLALAVVIAVVLTAVGLGAGRRYAELIAERDLAERTAGQVAACSERGALFVQRVKALQPLPDSADPIWEETPAVQIKLNRQTDTMPVLEEATVEVVRLQALTDGASIAWRVSWSDPTVDMNVDAGRFSDAVALQFPVTRGAAHTMGEHKQLVHILHWKGLWQRDVDEHFQDVQDLHPNYWADLYWFAEGEFPFRVPDAFTDPRSHEWFVALRAGNAFADIFRARSCEELSAEGFGSLTRQPAAVTEARGERDDDRWTVVFARPMRTDDPFDYQFWRGGSGSVSVAVWDGSAGNVGGRKHWTNWTEFEVSF